MLSAFIATHKALIIERTRAKVATRLAPRPTEVEMVHGVPLFLDQLMSRMTSDQEGSRGDIGASAALHGAELLAEGLTIGQVVHDYGDICQVITELAVEQKSQITNENFQLLNLCLDVAIADAVTEYSRQREEKLLGVGIEQLASLAHELRNLLNVATLAFRALSTNRVALGGSTGQMLGRTLTGMSDLVSRSLAEVRLEAGIPPRKERIVVADLLEELEIAAPLQAEDRDLQLSIDPTDLGLAVEADAQIVAAILTNLVNNACKFTREHGHIRVTATAAETRVHIEVADECGGLPEGLTERLFQPYLQHGADRSGMGLGLVISRKGARAMGGELTVRDVHGTGCVFALELPRAATRARATRRDRSRRPA